MQPPFTVAFEKLRHGRLYKKQALQQRRRRKDMVIKVITIPSFNKYAVLIV